MDDIREAFLEAMEYCNKKGLEQQKHVKPFISKGELRGYNVESGNTILKEIKVMETIKLKNKYIVGDNRRTDISLKVVKGLELLTDEIKERLSNFREPIFWSNDRLCHWFFDFKINNVWIESLNIDENFNIEIGLYN